jgi:hypothetical protein
MADRMGGAGSGTSDGTSKYIYFQSLAKFICQAMVAPQMHLSLVQRFEGGDYEAFKG